MLSFGQRTEGMHNVMFGVFQHLDTRSVGEGKTGKVRAATPWTHDWPPLPFPLSFSTTLTGVL